MEVNQDTGLEPGETERQNVSPGLSLHCSDPPYLTVSTVIYLSDFQCIPPSHFCHPVRPEAHPARPEAQSAMPEAQPGRSETQPASQASSFRHGWMGLGPGWLCLRPGWMAQRGERTDRQKNSPFYRNLSPIGAAGLPPPMNTKE